MIPLRIGCLCVVILSAGIGRIDAQPGPTGACCFDLFACSIVAQADCVASSGLWQGAGSVCGNCPCRVSCPAGASAEGEPICSDNYVDMVNAGCDAAPLRVIPVFFGDVVCGTTGVFTRSGNSVSDTDWYEITLPSATRLTVEISSESPVRVTFYDASSGCPGTFVGTGTTPACWSADFDAGYFSPSRFWIVISAIGHGDSSACGGHYLMRVLDPVGCTRGDLFLDGIVDGDDIGPFVDCLFTGFTSAGDCFCADMDGRNGITGDDVALFAARLLAGG